jgi:hypothetical protein
MGELLQLIFQKYNKATLTKKELAEELSISLSSLDNLLQSNQLPIRYIRLGDSQKAKYAFPIQEVSNFLETLS